MRERKLPTPEEHQRLTTLCLSAVICALVVSIVVELGHRGFDAMKLPPASFAGGNFVMPSPYRRQRLVGRQSRGGRSTPSRIYFAGRGR
jgi:hypothetical protein